MQSALRLYRMAMPLRLRVSLVLASSFAPHATCKYGRENIKALKLGSIAASLISRRADVCAGLFYALDAV